MIEPVFVFILKSVMCSALLMAYYLLVLKNAKMYTFNRFYLLGTAILSIVLPLVKLKVPGVDAVTVPDIPILGITGTGTEIAFTETTGHTLLNWQLLLAIAYSLVSASLMLILIINIQRVYAIKKKGAQQRKEGFVLVLTDDKHAPFSFMNLLFWPSNLQQDSVEGSRILRHEMAHINQLHTLDKIFMQLVIAACWINPFNWFIKKELWLQHEFLADEHAIENGDSELFARVLLYGAANHLNVSIVNSFFQSPIKRRLLMLTKSGKNTRSLLRSFLSIPILLTAVFLLSANTQKTAAVSRSHKKILLVLDAAHGGKDAGGKGIYGDEEKDITLAICKKIVSLSKEYNVKIVTTRDEDTYPTLEERIQKCNSTEGAIFLSVHVNQSSAVRDNTYQLGVNPKGLHYDQSILLASSIAYKLKGQKLPVEIVDHSMAYILRENKRPAILIECGNLDDIANIARLKDEAQTEKLCRNLLSGIVDYSARLEKQSVKK